MASGTPNAGAAQPVNFAYLMLNFDAEVTGVFEIGHVIYNHGTLTSEEFVF